MIASTVDEFGPVETATTLKALASMQMYADNARATSPHQTLSRTSRRRKKKEETTKETTEETNAADVDLAEGLARAVSRNAHRMHARLLALTLPALACSRRDEIIDAETPPAGGRRGRRRAGRPARRDGERRVRDDPIPPPLRVANEPNHAEGGKKKKKAPKASCAAEIAARIAATAGDMDRRCVALSLDSITRLRLLDDDEGDGEPGRLLGTLREALGAAAARVEREVTPTGRLGSKTEWERMRAGLRRLGSSLRSGG